GWTKQLIRVAERSVPAADWMRPAGRKPCCMASTNFACHEARCSGASLCASARATRRFTASMVRSSPLLYFSSRTSSLMDWAESAGLAGLLRRVLVMRVIPSVSVSGIVVLRVFRFFDLEQTTDIDWTIRAARLQYNSMQDTT